MTDARDRLRRPSPVAVALSAGLAAELALHFLEPRLAITWSHAHLGRRGALPWIGAALVLALPAASAWAWRRPGARRPLGSSSWRAAAVAAAVGAAVLALGRVRPAPLISIDPWFLVKSVAEGTGENGRWYLLLWNYQRLGAAVRPWLDAAHVIRTVSGLAASVAGAATLPGFGAPFAWGAFVARAHADSGWQLGLSPTSSLLPLGYMLSGAHAREVVHTLLLVDGVGVLLLVVCGGWLLLHPRTWSLQAALLALTVLPYLAYVVAMDPLFGAFADWDLFSYGAAATSLLGAYAFVVWGREHEHAFAWLLGLAIASAGVHLLARWNALDVDLPRHLLESPYHTQ